MFDVEAYCLSNEFFSSTLHPWWKRSLLRQLKQAFARTKLFAYCVYELKIFFFFSLFYCLVSYFKVCSLVSIKIKFAQVIFWKWCTS